MNESYWLEKSKESGLLNLEIIVNTTWKHKDLEPVELGWPSTCLQLIIVDV